MERKSGRSKSRTYVNGIELSSSLVFTGWQPGFEYTKNLNFKNLNTKSVKLEYKMPETKFFTTLFPKTISLSPGTTFTLPITFRPLEKKIHQDSIILNQLDFNKVIKIDLIAKIPEYKIELQDSLNMNIGCVNDQITATFKLKNTSELDTYFEWDIKEPFSFSPVNGELKSNSSIDITVTFEPKSALTYKGKAICKYGGNSSTSLTLFKTINLSASAKYPHILVETDQGVSSEATLNFDQVSVGQCITKYFTLINMTEVETKYFVEINEDIPKFDRCFNCLQLFGTLQPFEKQKIPISYCSNYPSSDVFHDYFNVYTVAKLSKNVVKCVATNKIPKVTLDMNLIQFGLSNVGDSRMKMFNIKNNSESVLDFQFQTDNEYSSFRFNQTCGTLQPNESKMIQVAFVPSHPIIYYKKVACLVQNHDVIYVEFIGTAHNENVKPPEINKKHINLYYHLKKEKLLSYSPEQLIEMFNNKTLSLDSMENAHQNYLNERGDNFVEEFINDSYHFGKDIAINNIDDCVQIDTYYADFGASKVDNYDENFNQSKSFTVFNQTKAKLVVYWNWSDKQPFNISPTSCEIPPMKSYSFRVQFKPQAQDQFYSAKLEGYAMYKSLIDYTYAEPKFVLPSWCLTLECIGHTFHPSADTYYIPKYTVDNENLIFPVSIKDRAVYRTFTLRNTASKYPLTFDFNELSIEGCYVKPLKGLIKKNEHQIVVFKFVPKRDSYVIEKCDITLNYMQKHLLEICLIGVGMLPLVKLENNGFLYFSPTCKDNFNYQGYEITNMTRCKVHFEWKIPYECKNLFSVDQVQSFLEPYERKVCMWRFSPKTIEKYNEKISLITWIDRTVQLPKSYSLRILSSSTDGKLQVADMYKDFGSVVVGSSVSTEIVLINNNDCNLDFELSVRQSVDESLYCKEADICILELESSTGHIEARSKRVIRCRLRPIRLINYQFTIEYRIVYPNEEKNEFLREERNDSPRNQKEILCYMTATGVFPKLSITDIKGLGSASSLSKDYLWKILSVNELNTSMGCEPNPEELIYSIATRQEANRRLAQRSRGPIIDMNFCAAPIDSNDTQVMLFVENTGYVPTEWALYYPKDLLLELEYWAQNGDYDLEELEELKVQNKMLFTVHPKNGKLEPGETAQVTITYKHTTTGINKLPVLLKIAKGREIMLNFIGVTINKHEPYVYFPSAKFDFEPVEIGVQEFPIQIYELYNGGDVPVEVEIDDSAFEDLNYDSFSWPILKCFTKNKIVIPPRSSFETKWQFAPIEAKTYQANVIFKINHIDFNVVVFKCIGYDKRKLNNVIVANRSNQEIPEKQTFTIPNQLATLSIDRIVLGDIPLFSRERKMLFIKNNSSEHKISFTWHVNNPDHVRIVRIQPSRGVVDVNQSKMCKVTFISQGKPQFHNIDLICEIKDENEVNEYRKELERWENEQTRQFEEFIIDEDELKERLNTSRDVSETSRKSLVGLKKPESQLDIHESKSLPPINKHLNAPKESNVDKLRKVRNEKKKWKKPVPPNPFLLHLSVIARTHYIDDVLEMTKTVKTDSIKFIDSFLGFNADKVKNDELETKSVAKMSCNTEEYEAIDFIISDLLRNLVSDKSFHVLVAKTKDEDVPYFVQYDNDEANKKIAENQQLVTSQATIENAKKSKKHSKNSQNIKTSPIFGALIENILENTVSNIITEAFNKEFSLTSRPRLIALPPKSKLKYDSMSNITSSFVLAKSKNDDMNTAASTISYNVATESLK